jgi:tRNA-2-methylthio-N6-dimethylallyladenosine synthase
MPSVYIKTYGCQMNERDSEAVAAQLMARGYSLVRHESLADVVLLNTCSVRDLAEQKAIGKMKSVVGSAKKHRPGQVYGFLGCMAQSRGEELVAQVPEIGLVLGTQKFHRAGEYLDELLKDSHKKIVDTDAEVGSESTIKEHLVLNPAQAPEGQKVGVRAENTVGVPATKQADQAHPLPAGQGLAKSSDVVGPSQVSAFVSIMQGCNQHCTFCIVPQTRGLERSRPIPEIVEECRQLVSCGVREITLLGQIVNQYGRRDYPPIDGRGGFVQLLDAVHAIDGLERIRFTSPHPKGYGADLVTAYERLPKLVESAHLPLQSGSNRILKQMHRGYTAERFVELVGQLRAVRPDIGLTTDIIVGFPGETDEDFEATRALCHEVRFDMAYVFKYSQRRDTPAAVMPGQDPQELIEDRHRILLDEINAVGRARYERLIGRTLEILVEGPSRRNAARYEGRTRCNKIVVFEGSPRHRGQVISVRIQRVGTFTLYGDPAIVNLDLPDDSNGPEDGAPWVGTVVDNDDLQKFTVQPKGN